MRRRCAAARAAQTLQQQQKRARGSTPLSLHPLNHPAALPKQHQKQWFTGRASTPPSAAATAAKVPQGKPLLLIGFNEAARQWEVNKEAADLLARIPGPLCTLAVCGRARQGKSFLLNTMLGRLSGQDLPPAGFQVSPTQHSCTRGLWMWSAPIPIKDADGRPCNLVRGCSAGCVSENPDAQSLAACRAIDPSSLAQHVPLTSGPLFHHTHALPRCGTHAHPKHQLLVDCEGVDAVDQGTKHSAQVFALAVLLSSVFVYNQLGAIDAVALERLAMVCELAKRVKDKAGGGGGGGGRGGQTDFHPAFMWLLR